MLLVNDLHQFLVNDTVKSLPLYAACYLQKKLMDKLSLIDFDN